MEMPPVFKSMATVTVANSFPYTAQRYGVFPNTKYYNILMEAIAMAGVDYVEWGLDIEEWERDDELPPPHLLAHNNENEEEGFMKRHAYARQGFSACINNPSPPSYNLEDKVRERSVSELCNPGVVRYWRS
ncbi:hypothetical protein J1N35_022425 [Gossypium stocksii]|uniref:Uncharacterized protein n=1 Tax=Gossypium stocksii TaxID=47602 RepID=A0A9D3VHP7_9ROSI|nr:hypothetical protein J1N35_022425 [Gossypium stocksii]